jgi:NitT/TauT family transport system substrate-binding protein
MQGGGWQVRLVGATCALGLALGALGCSGGSTGTGRAPAASSGPPAAPAAAGAPTTGAEGAAPARPIAAKAAFTSISFNQAPWWVAQEAGYFQQQGLDVDLSHVDSGATLLAALRNGELHFTASGGPALVLGHIQGLETVIVGSASSVLDAIVFTRPEIQTVQDLRGKTIGVTRIKAVTDVAARLGFQRVGLQPDVDVHTRGTGGLAESLAAVETGVVDGASLTVPGIFEARKRGLREALSISDMSIPFLTAGIGTTRRVLAEQPEMGDRFMRALAQAVHHLRTDRESAIDVLGKYSRSEDREVLGATVDYARPLYQTDLYPDPAAVQAVLDAEENPGARTTQPEDVTDYQFAERLRTTGFLDQLGAGR